MKITRFHLYLQWQLLSQINNFIYPLSLVLLIYGFQIIWRMSQCHFSNCLLSQPISPKELKNLHIQTHQSVYFETITIPCPITFHRLAHELMAHRTVKSPFYIQALLRSSWGPKGKPNPDMASLKPSEEDLYLQWSKISQTTRSMSLGITENFHH